MLSTQLKGEMFSTSFLLFTSQGFPTGADSCCQIIAFSVYKVLSSNFHAKKYNLRTKHFTASYGHLVLSKDEEIREVLNRFLLKFKKIP